MTSSFCSVISRTYISFIPHLYFFVSATSFPPLLQQFPIYTVTNDYKFAALKHYTFILFSSDSQRLKISIKVLGRPHVLWRLWVDTMPWLFKILKLLSLCSFTQGSSSISPAISDIFSESAFCFLLPTNGLLFFAVVRSPSLPPSTYYLLFCLCQISPCYSLRKTERLHLDIAN